MTFTKQRYAVLGLQLHGVFFNKQPIRVGRTYAQIKDAATDALIRRIEFEKLMGVLPQNTMDGGSPAPLTGNAALQNMTLGQMLAQTAKNEQAVGSAVPVNPNAAVISSIITKNLGLDNKYCLINVPGNADEERMRRLLGTWGRLRAFQLVDCEGTASAGGEEKTKAAFFE